METNETNPPPGPTEGQGSGNEARADSPADSGASADVAGTGGTTTAGAPSAAPACEGLPEDLRTPWSWGYLAMFLGFAFLSLVALEISFAIFGLLALRMPPAELERLATTSAPYITARQTVWFAVLMSYLFVVVRVFHGEPFWRTIGWKQLRPRNVSPAAAALLCVMGGAGLAVAISVAGRLVGTRSKLPIEALFRDRQSALLVMTLALLGAPLVEETVFRGYIYPVLARSFGVPAGVLATGALFGLLHAVQLGGAWGLVALLMLVGVVLTYVRARTGTVLASYLLHLGYNGMLFLGAALSTGGFRHFPPPT